ncbi:hypothetical protein KSP35_06690 [Aquihabitans sp. G128]|uniref:hypothetical protein n=1 Tax=Aquihabitans sp. G128 TaxID=2849779 RepID=UPI001C2325FA|nr:hypothetical protein [Aquihabitans sp. G128]QXC62483.1 hypothetical protein KSP35_06690 [Aquihabitans sp. G128]
MAAAALSLLVGLAGCSGSDGRRGSSTSVSAADRSTTSTTTTIPAQPPSTVPAVAGRPSQPAQATSGPGSSALAHDDWRVSSGGTGADAWYVFEPVGPRPKAAPVAVVLHGYYEFSGYGTMYELIRHTVLGGSIVVYPRWQTGTATPCPGPYDIEPCIRSALAGIRGALDFLRADPSRVQPDVDHGASYFGFSFGGILTADLANRWRDLDLPKPTAIFLDDPHDSGLDGDGEPSLDDSLAGIPSTVLLECHSGAQGVLAEPGKADSSCNAVFPLLGHIPEERKSLVATVADRHGAPALLAKHGVCAAPKGKADAYDWNFCWKVWDALRAAAAGDEGAAAEALGDTPEHRSNGEWSDGTPIAPLQVQAAAPIRP